MSPVGAVARWRGLRKADPGLGAVHVATTDWQHPTYGQQRRRRRGLPPQMADVLLSEAPLVLKAEPTQQLLTGWASVIEHPDGTPVVDSQGDIIGEADLVEAAQHFMRHARVACDNHVRIPGPQGQHIPKQVGTVVESLVVTRALKAALNLPPSTPTGWLVTLHIEDPAVWADVVAGHRESLSIGGTAVREEVE